MKWILGRTGAAVIFANTTNLLLKFRPDQQNGAHYMCSNPSKSLEKLRKALMQKNGDCRHFASFRKLQQTIAPPSHGGGHEFESRRVHQRNTRR